MNRLRNDVDEVVFEFMKKSGEDDTERGLKFVCTCLLDKLWRKFLRALVRVVIGPCLNNGSELRSTLSSEASNQHHGWIPFGIQFSKGLVGVLASLYPTKDSF